MAYVLKINGTAGRIPPVLFQGTEPPLLGFLAHFSSVNYMTTHKVLEAYKTE